MSAWEELLALLDEGEQLEWIVLGDHFVRYLAARDDEPRVEPTAIPEEKRNILLDPGDAEPLMSSWSIFGNRGAFTFQAWTDRRILRSETNVISRVLSLPRHPRSFHCRTLIPDAHWYKVHNIKP